MKPVIKEIDNKKKVAIMWDGLTVPLIDYKANTRRHNVTNEVVKWMKTYMPVLTHDESAELLGVTRRTITKMKKDYGIGVDKCRAFLIAKLRRDDDVKEALKMVRLENLYKGIHASRGPNKNKMDKALVESKRLERWQASMAKREEEKKAKRERAEKAKAERKPLHINKNKKKESMSKCTKQCVLYISGKCRDHEYCDWDLNEWRTNSISHPKNTYGI